jgi:hypothetical protein
VRDRVAIAPERVAGRLHGHAAELDADPGRRLHQHQPGRRDGPRRRRGCRGPSGPSSS